MSKLDELLRELCPNGVEYKKLGEIATVLRGASPRPIKKYITNDSDGVNWIKIGDVPVGSKYITQSEEKITKEGTEKSRYVRKGDFILSNSMSFGRPYILAIDGCIHDGWLSISNFKDVFLSDYLYYLLSSSAIQQEMKKRASFGGAVQNLNADIVKALVLPVPPIEVQNEIVRILDDYTENVVELQNQLALEITARQRQYEYYRDKLLTFAETGNTILSRAEQSRALIKLVQYVYGCVWLELGDVIVSLNTGLNPRKFFKLNTEDATNYYITIREMKDGKIVPSEKTDRMNDEARKLCNNRSNLEVGDVLFSGTGTIGETAVIEKEPSNWNIKEGVYAIKPNQTMIQPMYLRYILMTDFIKKEYMKKAAGGTVQSVPMGELKKIRIPVPSLREQNRIVGVLKKLDDLCNGLTNGLPAEIEARQKQYEYYRDKLLTFEERG